MTKKRVDESGGLDIIDKLVRPEKVGDGDQAPKELRAKKDSAVPSVVEKPVEKESAPKSKAAPVFGKKKSAGAPGTKSAGEGKESAAKVQPKSRAELELEEEQRIQEEIGQKVMEMVAINKQLALETEMISKDNGRLFDQAKRNKVNYEAILAKLTEKEAELDSLQHEITDARIACNHLLNDVVFLRDKNIELNNWVDDKSQSLGKLLSRVSAVKRNYEFISGESNFSEDILSSLDTLLTHTFEQKKAINDRLSDAKGDMDTLYEELQTTLRAGKHSFYQEMVGSSDSSSEKGK
jgi:hypothetical protein